MSASIRHITVSLLVVALMTTLVPFTAPAYAAGTGATAVGATGVGTAALKALAVIDADTVVAVGATGEIHKTVNGGATWTKVRSADTYRFVGVAFWDAAHGVAVDETGKVASTTNGGDTWTNVDFWPNSDMDQNDIYGHGKVAAVPGSGVLVAAAGDPDPGDDVDEGALPMWSNANPAFWGKLRDLQLKPHWANNGLGDLFPAGKALLLDVDFAGSGWVGIACGIDYWPVPPTGPETRFPVYTTAGTLARTWTARSVGDGKTNYRLNGVALGSTTDGVTVGAVEGTGEAVAFYTRDSGATWTASGSLGGVTEPLTGVDMSSATNGWAVSANGRILRTTDGGVTWSLCTVPVGTPALFDIKFADGTTKGWAVGASGTLLGTVDGVAWQSLPSAGGDVTPPLMGAITSSSHPVSTTWYTGRDATFAWSASDASGIAGYSYVLDRSAGTVPDTVIDGTGTTATYPGLADGEWYFHVRARDASANGNWSAPEHRRVRIDTTAPTGTVKINGGAASTNTRNVTLVLSGSDTGSGVSEMRVSEDGGFGGVAWEPYATSKPFTLSAGDGVKTVYAEFRDGAKNVSATSSGSIVLDTSVPPVPVVYREHQGDDRYGTAVAVSKQAFPAGSNAVIIATGLNFPDALASAGLAGVVDAPVLLVRGSAAKPDNLTVAEVDRLFKGRTKRTVYLIGGPVAISPRIEAALKARYGQKNVVRLGGADRFGTAYEVARRMRSEMASRSLPWSGDAFIVPGNDFRDALIVGPEAVAAHRPILLYDTRGTGGLAGYCSALGVKRAAVSGAPSGTGSVPVGLSVSGVTVSRIASAGTAPARSVEVADWAAGALSGFGWQYVGMVTADLYPDGLAAAPRMGKNKGPLLLTPSKTLDTHVRAALEANAASVREVRYFGGPVAIDPAVRSQVKSLLP